ncbi:MAG: retropepsin-like aspartic protease [Elusimicrobiota bacterium]|nr:retropepsin-like aspartic protease [Elusimicrobiota bacterium]
MGLIYKDVVLIGKKGKKKVKALFDTGSSESFISRKIAKEIAPLVEMAEPKTFETVNGKLKTNYIIFPDIQLDGHKLFWTLIIADGLTEEVILGSDFFQRWKIRLNPETEEIIWDPIALKLKLV